MTSTETSARVMGTDATVIVVGGSMQASAVVDHVKALERCWSRFLPDSELSRLNDAAGDLTVVSPTLFVLVDHLVTARRLTGGRFDPTLRDQMISLGYDRTYRELPDDTLDPARSLAPSAHAGGIVVMPSSSTVVLPAGVHLDPGGLGKGLAADLAAGAAMRAGADGVLVEIGGDIVTQGAAPDGGPWRISVPAGGDEPEQILEMNAGAVATSDTTARRWKRAGAEVGHVLDPFDGEPIGRHVRSTVVAGAGWWAEAAATAAIVSTWRNDGWLDELRDAGTTRAVFVREAVTADA